MEDEKIDMTEEDYNYIDEVVKKHCNDNINKIMEGLNPEYFIYEPDYDDYDD